MCHPLHPAGRATAQSDVPSSPSRRPCHNSVWCAIFSIPKAVPQLSDVPFFPSCRPCHSSDCSSPNSDRWGVSLIPGHFLEDMWCTKWHWDRIYCQHLLFPCQYYSTNLPFPLIRLVSKL
jgi:hypothetical protein